jgi:transposase InsO family protein
MDGIDGSHLNAGCRLCAIMHGRWTIQQFRDAIPADHTYGLLIHDRDTISSRQLDQGMRHLGVRVLRSPVRSPQANAHCERLLGILRRECLDFLIPLTENPHSPGFSGNVLSPS